MDYSFYLFCKLKAEISPSDECYDIEFPNDQNDFANYQLSDFSKLDQSEYDCMVDYLKYSKKMNVRNQVQIPKGQMDVVIKAMKFYIEISEKLNAHPTESEHYDIFDLNQLIAIFSYPISVSISKIEKDTFCRNHNVDFPIY